jgi:transcriptional pleiotropic regulator of transition state genes
MKNDKMIRTVDELGRVVLPKQVREILALEEKTKVEVRVDKERNEVILKKIFAIIF